MRLIKYILTQNDCFKAGKTITPIGIMVHSTGVNNPWLKRYIGPDDGLLGYNQYKNHWNKSGTGACVHAFIGKLKDGSIATYQTLPWNMRGWHCSSGTKGKAASGNNTHISFEICEDGLEDANYFKAIFNEAVELCAYLCKIYNLNPLTDIICHSEGCKMGIASNHSDVIHWFPKHGESMDSFRNKVNDLITAENNEPETETLDKNDEIDEVIKDNSPDAWAAEAVNNAVRNGILFGDDTGNYKLHSNCTRQEMLVFLYRFYKLIKN